MNDVKRRRKEIEIFQFLVGLIHATEFLNSKWSYNDNEFLSFWYEEVRVGKIYGG